MNKDTNDKKTPAAAMTRRGFITAAAGAAIVSAIPIKSASKTLMTRASSGKTGTEPVRMDSTGTFRSQLNTFPR